MNSATGWRNTTKQPRKNGAPEHKLQVEVRRYLEVTLSASVEWTANGAGGALSIYAANKAKAAGVRRGWPDLQFLFPDGVTRYIELKSETGSLSPEQRKFRDRCYATRTDMWAVCRSVEEVAGALTRWGARLGPHPFYPELPPVELPPFRISPNPDEGSDSRKASGALVGVPEALV